METIFFLKEKPFELSIYNTSWPAQFIDHDTCDLQISLLYNWRNSTEFLAL